MSGPDKANYKRSSRAFSLTEMIIVLGVMGMMIAVFSPVILASFGMSKDLSNAARELSSQMILARAEAVRYQTITRLVIPTEWPDDSNEGAYRKVSIWKWNPASEKFEGITVWKDLPEGIILEPFLPEYVKNSSYVARDGTLIRGDYILEDIGEEWTVPYDGREVAVRFIEFLPTGGARVQGGKHRTSILVAVQGYIDPETEELIRTAPGQEDGVLNNWAQVNVRNLTGMFASINRK